MTQPQPNQRRDENIASNREHSAAEDARAMEAREAARELGITVAAAANLLRSAESKES